MVILGIILALIGAFVPNLGFLIWLGIALAILGLLLNFVPIGGAPHRFY